MEFIIGKLREPVRKVKVLLVDDDSFIHEMMKLYLANTRYSLVSAMSTRDAIEVIKSDQPDILITDAMMPGESGFSLIEKIKALQTCADIPVILWTIMERPDGSVMDASGKADILVNKPFYRCDMMEALDKASLMLRVHAVPSEVRIEL